MIETIYVLEAFFLLGSILITAMVFFRKPKVTIPVEFEKVEKEIEQWLRNPIICAKPEVTSASQTPNWDYPLNKRVDPQFGFGLTPLGLTTSQEAWERQSMN
ncbi:hypothetical protein MUO79_01835 [Candidatus Bathyarchaeota archaeon]|nr:hypothetical protein [Candidatus Bathyarchaeota archaeon]